VSVRSAIGCHRVRSWPGTAVVDIGAPES